MSTDKQDLSPLIQKEAIAAYAAAKGLEIGLAEAPPHLASSQVCVATAAFSTSETEKAK